MNRIWVHSLDRAVNIVVREGWDPVQVGINVEHEINGILNPTGWYQKTYGEPSCNAIRQAIAFAPGVDYIAV